MSEPPEYWAFISYSHKDRKWGQWLHRELEAYRIPQQLVDRNVEGREAVPERLLPIFRDEEELAGSPDLPASIREALARSRNLIVLCSPHAARSRWVNEEIY